MEDKLEEKEEKLRARLESIRTLEQEILTL